MEQQGSGSVITDVIRLLKMNMDSLTKSQLIEIDSQILAGDILLAIRTIMNACSVGLTDAKAMNRTRYQQLRKTRPKEFALDDDEYWANYSDCIFDAMSRDF